MTMTDQYIIIDKVLGLKFCCFSLRPSRRCHHCSGTMSIDIDIVNVNDIDNVNVNDIDVKEISGFQIDLDLLVVTSWRPRLSCQCH